MCWQIILILVLTTAYCVKAQNSFPECDGVASGTFVASLTSCQRYVYCDGEDTSSGECDPGQYFDGELSYCDVAENVRCPLDEPTVEEPEGGDKETYDPTDGPVILTTQAPITLSTLLPNVDYTTMDTLNIPAVVKANCPQSDDPTQVILIPNNESCSDYYLCYHGHAIEMHCMNQFHFNTNTGQCDYPEIVKCSRDRPNAYKCLPHITDFFPHPVKCNYFYHCIKGYMTVQQCPFFYGWDIERRACVEMTQANCITGSKRT